MEIVNSEPALMMIAWSRIWSPRTSPALRAEAWLSLDLPDSFADHEAEYSWVFHNEESTIPVPLLLHRALSIPRREARQDWLEAAEALDLSWDQVTLEPDHLAAACEIFALALEQEAEERAVSLLNRYLLPWCEAAEKALLNSGSSMCAVIEKFSLDLEALEVRAHSL